jgi:hypothetical protein
VRLASAMSKSGLLQSPSPIRNRKSRLFVWVIKRSVLRERLFYEINQGFTCRSDVGGHSGDRVPPPPSPRVEEAVVVVATVATEGLWSWWRPFWWLCRPGFAPQKGSSISTFRFIRSVVRFRWHFQNRFGLRIRDALTRYRNHH